MIKPSKENLAPNKILLLTTLVLIMLGILMLSSVSSILSYRQFNTSYHYINHQILYGIIPGLIMGFFCYKQKLDFFKKMSGHILLFAIILSVAIFIPGLGRGEIKGAERWLNIAGFSLQPSEFLKLALVIYLAAWISNREPSGGFRYKNKKSFQANGPGLISFMAVFLIIGILLYIQKDLSTLGITLATGAIMYFVANTPLWHLPIIASIILAAGWAMIMLTPYRLTRLLTFLNKGSDALGEGYHINQSLIAVGSGSLFGLGLGMSRQKFGFLPESITDTIFPVFAEETGFTGSMFLLLLFIIFMWQGIKIAKQANDNFAKLLAVGITSWIFLQTTINIAAMIGLIPITGIPLPLISYGGSHMLSELMAIGLLLNISKK